MSVTQVQTSGITNDAVTTAKINFETALVPVGGIIMWSGSTASIPTGWALCNGANGTPNLRDRFIVGAGSGYGVGATGGSADAVVVAHSHGITEPNSGQGHRHGYIDTVARNGDPRYGSEAERVFEINDAIGRETNFSTTGITINSEGVSGANRNLPPYYALAFIMRVS